VDPSDVREIDVRPHGEALKKLVGMIG